MAQRAGGLEQAVAKARISAQLQRRYRAAGRFFRTQPLGAASLILILIMAAFALFAEVLDRYSPTAVDASKIVQAPSAEHWFGTDEYGRDMYSRIVHGTRISMLVAFAAIGLGTTVGYLLGLLSGYVGGKADIVFQRMIDSMLAFPTFLLALVFVAVLSPGVDKVIFAIALSTAPRAVRVSRGVAMSVKENVYIDAAVVIGASRWRVLLRHVTPNSLAPYLILASIGLGGAILVEASLSFLGLGVPPPAPSWGRMLSSYAQSRMLIGPWLTIIPGLAIMLLVLAFNLFGDTVRDIWDPKLRGR